MWIVHLPNSVYFVKFSLEASNFASLLIITWQFFRIKIKYFLHRKKWHHVYKVWLLQSWNRYFQCYTQRESPVQSHCLWWIILLITLWTSIFYTKKFGRNNARAECYLGNIHDIYTSTKFINHPVFSSKL